MASAKVLAILLGLYSVSGSQQKPPGPPTGVHTKVSLGLFIPKLGSEKASEQIIADASFTFDVNNTQYFDFELKIDKGVKYAEEVIWEMVPPPPPNAPLEDDADTKEEMWKQMGLDGDEALTIKARLTNTSFSMAIIVERAPPIFFFPKEGKTMCVEEKLDQFGKDLAQAFEMLPPGFGVHQMEPHPAQDETHFQEAFPPLEEAEADLVKDFDHALTPAGPGQPDEVDEDAIFKELAEQFKGMPNETQIEENTTMNIWINNKTGVPEKFLLTTIDNNQTYQVWINITEIKFKNFAKPMEAVCTDGKTFEDLVPKAGDGPLAPLNTTYTTKRLLSDRPLKLYALESLSTALAVVKTMYPQTHGHLPTDATRLWNVKDLEAAKMERMLLKRLHLEHNARVRWQKEAQKAPNGASLLVPGAGFLVVAFAVGAGMVLRSMRSAKRSEDQAFSALPLTIE